MATKAQVLALINQWIIANGNNEITADVLRPILEDMVNQINDLTGQLSNLATTDVSSLVAAINSVKQQIDQGDVAVHEGNTDPNITPPLTYEIGDFYIWNDGTLRGLFQYNGDEWVVIDSSKPKPTEIWLGNVPTAGDNTTIQEVVDFVNAQTFEVVPNEAPILAMNTTANGVPSVYTSFFFTELNTIGEWGTGTINGAVDSSQLIYNVKINDVALLMSQGNVITITGDITPDDIETYINNNIEPSLDAWKLLAGEMYFFKYTKDGDEYIDYYDGTVPAELGADGDTVVTASDFINLSINGNVGVTKNYVDTQDAATLIQANQYADSLLTGNKPSENQYNDLAAAVADQANQTSGYFQFILNGDDFSGVSSGWVYVEYLGTTLGTEADYRVMTSEQAGASAPTAFYPDYPSFPATGVEKVIYVDEALGEAHIWLDSLNDYKPLAPEGLTKADIFDEQNTFTVNPYINNATQDQHPARWSQVKNISDYIYRIAYEDTPTDFGYYLTGINNDYSNVLAKLDGVFNGEHALIKKVDGTYRYVKRVTFTDIEPDKADMSFREFDWNTEAPAAGGMRLLELSLETTVDGIEIWGSNGSYNSMGATGDGADVTMFMHRRKIGNSGGGGGTITQETLTDAATLAWDLDTQQVAKLTATSGVGNTRTLPNSVLTAGVDGGNYQLSFIQDATGGREISFDTNYIVHGEFNPDPNSVSVITVIKQGTKALAVITGEENIPDPIQSGEIVAALGYTPENVANKATDFSVQNNTLYPSVQAVVNWIAAQNFLTSISSNDVTTALGFTPEDEVNKAINFNTINDTLYPTVKAVSDWVNAQNYLSSISSGDVTGALGFTPENAANKATDFTTANNTLYPSVLAVQNWVQAQGFLTGITSGDVTTALGYTPVDAANLPNEEEFLGTLLENQSASGTITLNLETFSDYYVVTAGNITLAVSNTPPVGFSVVRNMTIFVTSGHSVSMPPAWRTIGAFVDGANNFVTLVNYTLSGGTNVTYLYINQET